MLPAQDNYYPCKKQVLSKLIPVTYRDCSRALNIVIDDKLGLV